MKQLLKILSIIYFGNVLAQTTPVVDQNNCFNQQPYTKTTDPNDNTPYSFNVSSFNYNQSPNGPGKPINFDWVNTTLYSIYTTSGLNAPNETIKSPFYCAGGLATDGGCGNRNLRIYNDITQDFANYTNNQQRLKAMDVLPEDGWELIKYSFGRAIDLSIASNDQGIGQDAPFVWLYNRYTGKMKFYIAVTNLITNFSNLNYATIKFTVNGTYDMFSNAQPISRVLNDFDNSSTLDATMNCDIQPIGNSVFKYQWLYAEFTTSYDPCVCRQIYPNAKLEYDVTTTTIFNYNLNFNGTQTPIYDNSGLMADGASVNSSSSGSFFNNLVGGGKAAIKGYKDWKEYAEEYKGYFNQIIGPNGTTPPTQNTNPQVLKIITSYAQSVCIQTYLDFLAFKTRDIFFFKIS